MTGQPLRGLVGQNMSGHRALKFSYARLYRSGTHTFTAPYSGQWKFILHGAGGQADSTNGGGSGAYVEKTITMNAGQTAALVVGAGNSGTATTVTVAGVPVVSAGAAGLDVAGVASGGDVMLNGTTGGLAGASGSSGLGAGGGAGGTGGAGGGGSGAPGSAEFPGGVGATYSAVGGSSTTPGGGGAASSGADTSGGGNGQIIVLLVSY